MAGTGCISRSYPVIKTDLPHISIQITNITKFRNALPGNSLPSSIDPPLLDFRLSLLPWNSPLFHRARHISPSLARLTSAAVLQRCEASPLLPSQCSPLSQYLCWLKTLRIVNELSTTQSNWSCKIQREVDNVHTLLWHARRGASWHERTYGRKTAGQRYRHERNQVVARDIQQ